MLDRRFQTDETHATMTLHARVFESRRAPPLGVFQDKLTSKEELKHLQDGMNEYGCLARVARHDTGVA